MDAEFENKLKEIGGMLGITEIPENIGDLVSTFLGSGEETTEAVPDAPGSTAAGELVKTNHEEARDEEDAGESAIDPAMLLEIVGKLGTAQKNSKNDKKIKLLRALRPFLGKERQAKVDQCVRLMMLSEFAPYLKKLGSK